uniref:Uncharacterized protein n=1 Tax=Oryza punctata TaxID=4537 RepID=A0A0E0MLW2_ORYPU
MSFLLHFIRDDLQEPRHLAGGSCMPSSSNEDPPLRRSPRKSGVCVVKRGRRLSLYTLRTPSFFMTYSFPASVRSTAKPKMVVL